MKGVTVKLMAAAYGDQNEWCPMQRPEREAEQ
jgi:hypothetical protein